MAKKTTKERLPSIQQDSIIEEHIRTIRGLCQDLKKDYNDASIEGIYNFCKFVPIVNYRIRAII